MLGPTNSLYYFFILILVFYSYHKYQLNVTSFYYFALHLCTKFAYTKRPTTRITFSHYNIITIIQLHNNMILTKQSTVVANSDRRCVINNYVGCLPSGAMSEKWTLAISSWQRCVMFIFDRDVFLLRYFWTCTQHGLSNTILNYRIIYCDSVKYITVYTNFNNVLLRLQAIYDRVNVFWINYKRL